MNQDTLKKAAAKAALEYIENDMIVGVGTGSTADYFIDFLAGIKQRIEGAVASSEVSANRLRAQGIPVLDLNAAGQLSIYVDGTDEATRQWHLIKGGGGALTREKIVAGAADKFICIADESKLVNILGRFPLPIEVIPMGRSFVARELVKRGGKPILREGFITDNGCEILDVHNLEILDPPTMEAELNMIPGIVTVGIFAARPADILLLATEHGVETITR